MSSAHPRKEEARKPERNVITDDFDFCVVKRTVIYFYDDKKIVRTCNKLLPLIRETLLG
jgi:hypothetical protein